MNKPRALETNRSASICRRIAPVALLAALGGGCAPTLKPTTNPTSPPSEFAAPEYRLAPRDVLEIKFFYQSELNETVSIRPDGMISLQMVDEVRAAGRTPAELDAILTEKYSHVLRGPDVAVILKNVAPRKVYVGGEVNAPGMLTYDDSLTVLQAIMQAGGHKKTGEIGTVVVLRNNGGDKPSFQTLDLRGDLANGRLPRDIQVAPQDIIFVPRSTIAQLDDFMEMYFDKLIPVQKSVGVFYDLSNGTR